MRDWQAKQNIGGVSDSNLAIKDGAGEYTSLRTEAKTAVSDSGLLLAPQSGVGEDNTQLSQSIMINGMAASSFQAAGTVDAITLTPLTGLGGLRLPPDYSTLHGARVGFHPIGLNTGNVTISIGQDAGSQFSVKKALNNDGTELPASTLSDSIYAEFVYDETADASAGAFVLVPYSLASGGGGGGDVTKVDTDLFSDVDYVPKVTLVGTESFYIDDSGIPKKVLASNITTADTNKVDKDLSNDVTYVPTSVIDDTDDYYVDKAGVPSKISGADLKAQLTVIDIQTITSSGLWTKPASGTRVLVQIWGAGASGGRGGGDGGSGGGGGAYIQVWFDIGDLGATETVTIGAGGAPITVANTDGNVGGSSFFGSFITIFGGGGGVGNSPGQAGGGGGGGVESAGNTGSGTAGGDGGAPLGGTAEGSSTFGGGAGGENVSGSGGNSVNGGGGGGEGQNSGGGAPGGDGGDSIYGGGGGGGWDDLALNAGAGGNSVSGGNGGDGAVAAAAAGSGLQPAGGGGGSETGDSGAGGDGQCIVTTF